MAGKPSFRMDLRGLEGAIEAFTKVQAQAVQVGVFSGKSARKSSAEHADRNDNAYLGLIHEFGGGRSPARSFLRMPMLLKKAHLLMASRASARQFAEGEMSATNFLKSIGINAENIVQQAFDTAGWGSWPQNSYRTIMAKLPRRLSYWRKRQLAAEVMFEGARHTAPLIATAQLRRAIASRVQKSSRGNGSA